MVYSKSNAGWRRRLQPRRPQLSYTEWARGRVNEILQQRSSRIRKDVLQLVLANRLRVGPDAEEWRCLLRAFSFEPKTMQRLREEIIARNAHLKVSEEALDAVVEGKLDKINETTPIRLREREVNQLITIATAYLKREKT